MPMPSITTLTIRQITDAVPTLGSGTIEAWLAEEAAGRNRAGAVRVLQRTIALNRAEEEDAQESAQESEEIATGTDPCEASEDASTSQEEGSTAEFEEITGATIANASPIIANLATIEACGRATIEEVDGRNRRGVITRLAERMATLQAIEEITGIGVDPETGIGVDPETGEPHPGIVVEVVRGRRLDSVRVGSLVRDFVSGHLVRVIGERAPRNPAHVHAVDYDENGVESAGHFGLSGDLMVEDLTEAEVAYEEARLAASRHADESRPRRGRTSAQIVQWLASVVPSDGSEVEVEIDDFPDFLGASARKYAAYWGANTGGKAARQAGVLARFSEKFGVLRVSLPSAD